MIPSAQRPLLFLDVDGPLIPFGATREQYPEGYPTYRPQEAGANPLPARVDPTLGPRLLALPCDLVWATTWESEANDCLAPLLGLPQLPVVTWPEPSDEPEPAGLSPTCPSPPRAASLATFSVTTPSRRIPTSRSGPT